VQPPASARLRPGVEVALEDRHALTLAGRLSHTSAQSTWAVTGGSGVYTGARGTAVLRQVSGKRTAVTISLV
jgi:hypothetical protein